jgi:hypothetical protein
MEKDYILLLYQTCSTLQLHFVGKVTFLKSRVTSREWRMCLHERIISNLKMKTGAKGIFKDSPLRSKIVHSDAVDDDRLLTVIYLKDKLETQLTVGLELFWFGWN